jgi:RNA polymerase sigma-54 factor
LQLREANRLDPAMAALLDHLDLLVEADMATLARRCGIAEDDLPEMIAEIKALYPKPGLAYASEPIAAVVPDIFVQRTADGWRVELNATTLPRVLINHNYYVELCRQATDKPAKAYLSERLQSANWLLKALDQRARTLLKVAEAVVAHQLPCLEHGVHHLRPLLLRDIAEITDLHESTVSRATADKYLATPRGNFPFRYFFSNALPAVAGGAGHAAEAIRQQIKAMIDREEPANVLSDDQIVEALRRTGVAIARRTVAKYREALAIPSSVQRRRAKALGLA